MLLCCSVQAPTWSQRLEFARAMWLWRENVWMQGVNARGEQWSQSKRESFFSAWDYIILRRTKDQELFQSNQSTSEAFAGFWWVCLLIRLTGLHDQAPPSPCPILASVELVLTSPPSNPLPVWGGEGVNPWKGNAVVPWSEANKIMLPGWLCSIMSNSLCLPPY